MHPHIAPWAPFANPSTIQRSAFFNLDVTALPGAETWDPGDAIMDDTVAGVSPGREGGFASLHDGSGVTLACIHDSSVIMENPNTGQEVGVALGWHRFNLEDRYGNRVVQRFQGYLRPPGVPQPFSQGGTNYVDDAAFELFAPDFAPGPSDEIVFFLRTPGSFGAPARRVPGSTPIKTYVADDRHSYPGQFSKDGLYRPEDAVGGPTQVTPYDVSNPSVLFPDTIWRFEFPLTPLFDTQTGSVGGRLSTANIYPITGYIVHSQPNKQTTFQIQRNMELIAAVQAMLTDPSAPVSWRPPGVAVQTSPGTVVAVGGSNGGNVASWMALAYPDRVHGALATVFPPSLRREVGEHAFWGYLGNSTGFSLSGAAYEYQDALQWAFFPSQLSSAGNRFTYWDLSWLLQANANTIPRPIFFVCGDEDTTTTGTDWVQQLTGSGWSATGRVPLTGTEFVSWSIADNRCHESGPYTHPVSGSQEVGSMHIMPDIGLAAIASRNVTSGSAVPQRAELSGRQLTADDVYDPPLYDSAAGGVTFDPQGPGHYRLSADFGDELGRVGKAPGAGTWLGRDDTMLIRGTAGPTPSLYVGSGDGVVSRYVIDTSSTLLPLKLEAQSEMLGPGISGLTHGVFGSFGTVAVAATYGRIFVLDPQSLAEIDQVDVSFDAFRPRRILLGDMDPGLGDGPELVCASHNGGVLIFGVQGQQVVEKLHWAEPGVIDMVERNGVLTLLSARGVVATVYLNANPALVGGRTSGSPFLETDYQNASTTPAYLVAASNPQSGFPLDLELDSGGQNSVVALYRSHTTDERSIRRFASLSGALVHGTGDVFGNGPTIDLSGDGSGVEFDVETVRYSAPPGEEEGSDTDGFAGDTLLVLSRGSLFLLDPGFNLIGKRDLGSFAPTNRAVDIAVGDLYPALSIGGYDDEVVISTQGGRLVWMNVGELLSVSNPELQSPYTSDDRTATGDPHSNQSTSATWGMDWDAPDASGNLVSIAAFDQNMTHWSLAVPGSGPTTATFVGELDQAPPIGGFYPEHVKGAARIPAGDQPGTALPIVAIPMPEGWSFHGPVSGMLTFPHYPKDGGRLFLDGPYANGSWTNENPSIRFWQRIWGEYTVFPQPGGVLDTGASIDVHWWSGRRELVRPTGGTTFYGNIVEGYDLVQSQLGQWWSSTFATAQGRGFLDLRSADAGLAGNDLQSLEVLEPGLVLLGTPGGTLAVVDTQFTAGGSGLVTTSPMLAAESLDLGHGVPDIARMLIGQTEHIYAVCALDHQPASQLWSGSSSSAPQPMVGAVHHFTRAQGGTTLTFVSTRRLASLVPASGGGASVNVVAPVGVAVHTVSAGVHNLVVTGALGHVLVYRLSAGGGLPASPRQIIRLRGMVGMHGSMLVDGGDLYIAGSQGVWKLEVQ